MSGEAQTSLMWARTGAHAGDNHWIAFRAVDGLGSSPGVLPGIEAVVYWSEADVAESARTGEPTMKPAGWYVVIGDHPTQHLGMEGAPDLDHDASDAEQAVVIEEALAAASAMVNGWRDRLAEAGARGECL